jgi:hypothetical protein
MWNFSAVTESPDSLVPYHLATGVDFDSVMLAPLTRKLFDKRVGLHSGGPDQSASRYAFATL